MATAEDLEKNIREFQDVMQVLSAQIDAVQIQVKSVNRAMDSLVSCLDGRVKQIPPHTPLDQPSGQRVLLTRYVRRRSRPGELNGAQQFFRAAGKPTKYHTVRGYDYYGRRVSIVTGYYG